MKSMKIHNNEFNHPFGALGQAATPLAYLPWRYVLERV